MHFVYVKNLEGVERFFPLKTLLYITKFNNTKKTTSFFSFTIVSTVFRFHQNDNKVVKKVFERIMQKTHYDAILLADSKNNLCTS